MVIVRTGAQLLVAFVIFALALFVPGDSFSWTAGWIFLGMFFGFSVFLFGWMYKRNPDLLRERMRFDTSDQEYTDKILFPVLNVVLLSWLVFTGLDATRFHWSPVPISFQTLGGALLMFSFYVLFQTFRSNSFLSPVVRVQRDRKHTTVSSGPYRYVRHPMYSAILILVIGASLLLGSGFGALWAVPTMVLLGRRAALEERVLGVELAGYSAYSGKVKNRLIPYLW